MFLVLIKLFTTFGITIAVVISGSNQVEIHLSHGLVIGEIFWEVVVGIKPFLMTVGLSHIRPE